MELHITLNNEAKCFNIQPGEALLGLLRREGYHGPKSGCTNGDCGACAVLLNGKPVNSCLIMAAHCEGCSVTTIEGIGNPDLMHPIQEAFVDLAAAQCGYCTPGMIVATYALLRDNPNPTEADIRDGLAGNLCRCTGYTKPIEAVQKAAELMKK